eukprot:s4874_g4.t1
MVAATQLPEAPPTPVAEPPLKEAPPPAVEPVIKEAPPPSHAEPQQPPKKAAAEIVKIDSDEVGVSQSRP